MACNDKEKKAMVMVEDYYHMIEGDDKPSKKDGGVPSQDRKEMYEFLEANKSDSQLIEKLYQWVINYDVLRNDIKELRVELGDSKKSLYSLLGKF